jgi:formate-dependent nitrite reductase cytochrome c552 subunit
VAIRRARPTSGRDPARHERPLRADAARPRRGDRRLARRPASDQNEGWLKSSHRAVAVCSDCHIEAAKAAGATDEDLAGARQAQPRGQFFVDFVESENSSGFHARQEATRILGDAIDLFRKPRCRCGR